MGGWLTSDFYQIIAAAFFVGIVVGLTGMGGGALMTPALSSSASVAPRRW